VVEILNVRPTYLYIVGGHRHAVSIKTTHVYDIKCNIQFCQWSKLDISIAAVQHTRDTYIRYNIMISLVQVHVSVLQTYNTVF